MTTDHPDSGNDTAPQCDDASAPLPCSNTPDNLVPIPGFPGYAIHPTEHDIWRVGPTKRKNGVYTRAVWAPKKLKPQIHPRGRSYTVVMTHKSGKRPRVSIPLIVFNMFGHCHTRMGSLPYSPEELGDISKRVAAGNNPNDVPEDECDPFGNKIS